LRRPAAAGRLPGIDIQTAATTAPATTTGGFLRAALKLDAAVTGANALAYLAAFALRDGLRRG